ncbi:MAG: hypothetical protein LBT78_05470 [Tannerella sp.]|nr:hypothetical protein [Tannerella sp.]
MSRYESGLAPFQGLGGNRRRGSQGVALCYCLKGVALTPFVETRRFA